MLKVAAGSAPELSAGEVEPADVAHDEQLAFDEARDYELLTQAVYREILEREGDNSAVEHDVSVHGRSGARHQCDVYWRFKQAGVEHTVVIECKLYARPVTIGNVRDFFGVLHDLGGARGIMVTRNGFQSGAAQFAEHYGISAKVLRPPQGSDWDGHIQKIETNVIFKWFDERDHRIQVYMEVAAGKEESRARLAALQVEGRLQFPKGPRTRLRHADGSPATEEFGWWIPKQVNIVDKTPGGPYVEEVDVAGLYVPLTIDENVEHWPLKRLQVTYFVRNLVEQKITIDAADVVKAVLQDFFTGEVEHFHRK